MTNSYYPLRSLEQGNWLKLICGASFQHLPSVRNLTLAYALSGVDCIDVSADGAVIAAAKAALKVARSLKSAAQNRGYGIKQLPWLMVSLNASEDPHFRKAAFDPSACPPECPRPCELICPAQAIVFSRLEDDFSGVLEPNCYGCGRCLPICPSQLIRTRSYLVPSSAIAPLVLSQGVDAVEIHTQVGQYSEFAHLWSSVKPWVSKLKLVAISCPDGEGLIDYLWSIYKLISPLHQTALIWQTDGRPMSGDIGDGTTIAAVKLAQKVLAANLPGYVQLAGGTNSYTVPKLQKLGMLGSNLKGGRIAGVAYGSYARVLLSPILERLEQLQINKTNEVSIGLEQEPQLLWEAVNIAQTLVSQLKPIPTTTC